MMTFLTPLAAGRPTVGRALAVLLPVMAALFFAFGLHNFVPVLGRWEYFQYVYNYGVVEPHLSLAIAPRANLAGKGYLLVDVGTYLTDLVGLSTTTFRATTYLYAAAAYAGMVIVMSRWFGVVPALLGVTLSVISTGYVFFANQTLVTMPTLMLCVFLVERCQRLRVMPEDLGIKLTVGLLLALLMTHYSLGRYFALGWLGFFIAARYAIAYRALPSARLRTYYALHHAMLGVTLAAFAVIILCLFDLHNIGALLDLKAILVPRNAEAEVISSNILSTIGGNFLRAGELVFPGLTLSGGDGSIDPLLTGNRAALLNYWHLPFLAVGIAVSLRRTFAVSPTGDLPYISLHAICLLTLGLAMLSAHYGDSWTLSPYRVFCGYLAIAGYATVGFLWVSEAFTKPVHRRVGLVMAVILFAGSLLALRHQGGALAARADAKAVISEATGRFAAVPDVLPYGAHPDAFLQARYRKLARELSSALSCTDLQHPALVNLSPSLLLNNGSYDGTQYLESYNDLSTVLVLYLRELGLNAAFVIVHGKHDPGFSAPGHGYAGKPRVFSGPIEWRNGEIIYRAQEPLAYDLRASELNAPALVVVSFSNAETEGARALMAAAGVPLMETGVINTFDQLRGKTRLFRDMTRGGHSIATDGASDAKCSKGH